MIVASHRRERNSDKLQKLKAEERHCDVEWAVTAHCAAYAASIQELGAGRRCVCTKGQQ